MQNPSSVAAVALFAVAATLSAAPARADRAAEARFHDELARRHYAARRFEPAAREFMIEQRLAPNPNIVFNIALCFQHLRRHPDAYMYFAEYLAAGTDESRRTQAQTALRQIHPHVALVRVESDPPGASIFVDRRELGQYGTTPRVLALDAGEHRIWVELDGYRNAERTTELSLGNEATVRLSPEQILGRLRVGASTAAQVRVIDAAGELVAEGATPFDEELPPGTYQVEASAGEERWSEPLLVRGEATTEATASLRGPTGEMTVMATVTGALVSLDGRERGFTPQVLRDIPVGEHALTVTSDGTAPYRGTIEIGTDYRAWASVTLEPVTSLEIQPYTWAVGGLTLAILGAAAITTGFAVDTHDRFEVARANDGGNLVALSDQSTALNFASDMLWLGGALSAAVTVVLFVATTDFGGRASRATIERRPTGGATAPPGDAP